LNPPVHFTAAVATTWSVIGPSQPDSWSGSPGFHRRQRVKVKRPVGLGWPALTHCGHSLSVPMSGSQAGVG
jgi:hypothetical protein